MKRIIRELSTSGWYLLIGMFLFTSSGYCVQKLKVISGTVITGATKEKFSPLQVKTAESANLVKIATIGTKAPAFNTNDDMEEVVEAMIRFWDAQIKKVLPDNPDLIVLPEFFDIPSGFSPGLQEEYIKVRNDRIHSHLLSISLANNCYIAYGTLRKDEDGNLRNSAILLDRKGEIAGIYNKNFPTIGEMENGIVAGTEAPVFECDFGKVAFAICFDLNFEELRDHYASNNPDILLFLSMYHGGHVQSNWAYATRSYFIGSVSGRGTFSEIRDPLGEIISSNTNYFNYTVATINLNSRLVHLGYNFEKLRKLKEKYGSSITIKDPGNLGPVLVSSENENIDRVLSEFNIELMHDYYNRSRQFRLLPGNMKQENANQELKVGSRIRK